MAVDQHLQPGEEVLYRAHPSRISLIPPLVGAALALGLGIAASRFVDPTNQALVWIVAGIPALFLVAVAGLRYLRLASREFILTNHRLIRQEGIFAKKSIDSYLEKINNIEYFQTFWGRILGYGDLRIDTANEAEPSEFQKVADPLGFKRAISAAAEAYRSAGVRPLAATAPSGAERLRQLKALLDDGLISQAEFDIKRKQLLDEM